MENFSELDRCLKRFCAAVDFNKYMANRAIRHLPVFKIYGCPTLSMQKNLQDCIKGYKTMKYVFPIARCVKVLRGQRREMAQTLVEKSKIAEFT